MILTRGRSRCLIFVRRHSRSRYLSSLNSSLHPSLSQAYSKQHGNIVEKENARTWNRYRETANEIKEEIDFLEGYQYHEQEQQRHQQHHYQQNLGPCGKYQYYNTLKQRENGEIHCYVRVPSQNHGKIKEEEIVLEFAPRGFPNNLENGDENLYEISGPMSLSHDEEYIAYILKKTSFDVEDGNKTILMVRHISSGKEFLLPPHTYDHLELSNAEFGLLSRDENNGSPSYSLFFTTFNSKNRPDRVFLTSFKTTENGGLFSSLLDSHHATFSSPKQIISELIDESAFVDISRSKGLQYIICNSTSKTNNQVWLIPSILSAPQSENCIIPVMKERKPNISYFVDVGSDSQVYILAYDSSTASKPCTKSSSKNLVGSEMSLFETMVNNLPLELGKTNNGNHYTLQGDDHTIRCLHEGKPIVTNTVAEIPHVGGSVIEDMDIFQDFIVLYERIPPFGQQQIRIILLHNEGEENEVVIEIPPLIKDQKQESLPEIIPTGNIYYKQTKFQFLVSWSCLHVLPILYEWDLATKNITQLTPSLPSASKEIEHTVNQVMFGNGYVNDQNNENYDDILQTKHLLIDSSSSNTGIRIPLTVSYYKQKDRNETTYQRPTLLIGYGAYGSSSTNNMTSLTSYNPHLIPLLKRGWMIAYAHCRGGGELGKSWYGMGRSSQNKKNVLSDFLDCANALKKKKKNCDKSDIPSASFLASKGFSAGGVIVGSSFLNSSNYRENLFDAVILTSAFLNVYETMKNKDLPLTEHEFDEWGNPIVSERDDKEIQLYCPTQNIIRMASSTSLPLKLPKILLIGSLDDPQVPVLTNAFNFGLWAKTLNQNSQQILVQENKKNKQRWNHQHKIRPEDISDDDSDGIHFFIPSTGGHHFEGMMSDVVALETAFLNDSFLTNNNNSNIY